MKYRKKPVVIKAIQFNGDNVLDLLDFMGDNMLMEGEINSDYKLYAKTLEGNMRISKDDFVIKGVQGEFYPCKPGIFETTYEKI